MFKFLSPTIREIINPQNEILISKIIYTSSKTFDKEIEYDVYLIAFEKYLGSVSQFEGEEMDSFDDYVKKLCSEISFVEKNYGRMVSICEPKYTGFLNESIARHLKISLGF